MRGTTYKWNHTELTRKYTIFEIYWHLYFSPTEIVQEWSYYWIHFILFPHTNPKKLQLLESHFNNCNFLGVFMWEQKKKHMFWSNSTCIILVYIFIEEKSFSRIRIIVPDPWLLWNITGCFFFSSLVEMMVAFFFSYDIKKKIIINLKKWQLSTLHICILNVMLFQILFFFDADLCCVFINYHTRYTQCPVK